MQNHRDSVQKPLEVIDFKSCVLFVKENGKSTKMLTQLIRTSPIFSPLFIFPQGKETEWPNGQTNLIIRIKIIMASTRKSSICLEMCFLSFDIKMATCINKKTDSKINKLHFAF